jgi:hypothetical protein
MATRSDTGDLKSQAHEAAASTPATKTDPKPAPAPIANGSTFAERIAARKEAAKRAGRSTADKRVDDDDTKTK